MKSTMNKKKLITAFIEYLEGELLSAKDAARATYEAATHEESKPENEYDTRGLEASYLAGAQAKRAGEIEEVLTLFKTLEFHEFAPHDVVQSTALVEVETRGKRTFLLVMPKGGGFSIKLDGHSVQIMTPSSTLGEAILGLKVGEVAEIEVNGQLREYEIISLA
ncbi:MAG: GreA/GreB family elongation factor [Bdellovibrionaceae bacterium]|nr:GreA/GreB family elongation factor [Pseudobdellovibrionaceae bacterium]